EDRRTTTDRARGGQNCKGRKRPAKRQAKCRPACIFFNRPVSFRFAVLPERQTKGSSETVSTFAPSASSITRDWHVIDAKNLVLGRVASRAARLLQGKHKPSYAPFLDTGDHVVIVNAAEVKLTGNKEEQKIYRRHSGYEGGLREERAKIVR